MRVKKYCVFFAIIGSIFILSGCGEKFPDLSQEEYDQTVEYAVGILMKYSNNGQERLVYVDAKEEQKSRERQARKDAKDAEKEQETTEPATAPKPVKEQTPPAPTPVEPSEGSSEENVMTGEDLATAEVTTTAEDVQDNDSGSAQMPPNAVILSSDESQEISPDLFLSYQGYSVSSTYPESSKSYVVNADKGKKLLVLRFDLYNGSDSDKDVNMLKYNLLFQVLLNDRNIGYTSVTFLPNDLSSYIGTIESRSHESLVVLTQIGEDEATHIESLGMIVGEGESEQTVYLK